MPKGTYKRSEETRRKLGDSLKEFYRKKRISEAKKEINPEEKDKSDFSDSQIKNMSKDELLDTLTSVRIEIDKRIRTLAKDFRALTSLQNRQEEIETRLEGLGMRLKG